MKIYIKLAFAYLRRQKARTFFMILAVSLAVMLVFGYDVINSSYNKKQLDIVYRMYGSYDGVYSNLDRDELEKIKTNKDVKRSGGVAVLGEIISDNGTSLSLRSSDKNYIEILDYNLEKGRLPDKDGEIVLESKALKHMNIEEKLGQTIRFKVKKEYKDEFGTNQIFIETKDFKLVGIANKSDYHYQNDWYEFRGFTFFKEGKTQILPENLITYQGIVKLKSKGVTLRKLRDLGKKYDIGRENIRENELLVMARNEYASSERNRLQKPIIATSMILIYNMFNMSLMDMIKQIGLLRAIGVSKKKIRFIMSIQSLFISFMGILLGLIFGLAYSYFGIKIFGSTAIDLDINISSKDIHVNMKSVVNAIAVGTVSVLISTIISIWISGRVSPIEASKKVDKTTRYSKKGVSHRIIRKLLGVTGEMAYSNIGRNKFKSIISIIAISIGGVTYIDQMGVVKNNVFDSTDTYMISMNESSFKLSKDISSDRYFSGYTESDIQEISNIDGVKSIETRTESQGFLKLKSNELEEEYKKYNSAIYTDNNVEVGMFIAEYDNDSWTELKEYVEENEDLYQEKGEYPDVAVYNYYHDNRYKKTIKNLKVGDIITIKIPEIKKGLVSYKDQKLRVGALLKENWAFKKSHVFMGDIQLVTPEKTLMGILNKDTYSKLYLKVEDGKDKHVYKEIKEIFKNNPSVTIDSKIKLIEENDEWSRMRIKKISIQISLILFVAMVNIFGTIKTNLLIRINEFSMLRAIGMTTKQLKNMIIIETIMYGILSSILTNVLGAHKYYRLIKRINDGYRSMFNVENIEPFQLPVDQMLQYTAITMIVCIAVAYLSKRDIEKLSIVEGLKTVK